MPLIFRFCGLSDIGLARSNNEDVWIAQPEIGFFALADGMGGHLAGEVAAKEAIDHLSVSFANRLSLFNQEKGISTEQIVHALTSSIESANKKVYHMSKERQEYAGMGTTLCCLYWTHDAIIYAHAGDSRLYRWRGGELQLLTQDHSLFSKWMALGEKAAKCTTPYPYKHVITKAIGTHPKSHPEVAVSSYEPSDLFLLCTDGLSDALSTQEMEAILHKSSCLEKTAHSLIQLSKDKGSCDNITVLMTQRVIT